MRFLCFGVIVMLWRRKQVRRLDECMFYKGEMLEYRMASGSSELM